MDKTKLEENFCDHLYDICIDCCPGKMAIEGVSLIQGKLKSFDDRDAKIQEVALKHVLTSKIGGSG